MLTPLTVAPAPQPTRFVRTGFNRPLGAMFMKYMRQADRSSRHPENYTLLEKSDLP